MPKTKAVSNSYIHILQQAGAYDSMIDQANFRRNILNLNQQQIPAITYMTDMTQRKYLAIAGCSLIGHKENDFLNGGLDFYIDCWQRDDFEIYNNQVFPDLIDFLKHNQTLNTGLAIFSFNYKIKTRFGKEMMLLQRTSLISDFNTRVPLSTFGIAFDITQFNCNPWRTYTIENIEDGSILFRKSYFAKAELKEISKAELQVLKWLSEGLSSKQIADRLKLSIHTINNHRKSMLNKTNCLNSVELVKKAFELGVL